MGLEGLVLWLQMWCLQNYTAHTNQRVHGKAQIAARCLMFISQSTAPILRQPPEGLDEIHPNIPLMAPILQHTKHPQSLPACPLPPPGSHLLGAAGGPWLSYRLRLDFLLGEPSQGCLQGRPQRPMKKSGCLFVKNSRTPQKSWCIWAILNPTPPTRVSFPSTLPANFRV